MSFQGAVVTDASEVKAAMHAFYVEDRGTTEMLGGAGSAPTSAHPPLRCRLQRTPRKAAPRADAQMYHI